MDDSVAPAIEETREEARYLKAVARCGDNRSLMVAQPIYSANGIKLLDTGARIDSRILDRLFGHTLAEPIDRCVAAEDGVRHHHLVARTRELVAAVPLLATLDASLQGRSGRLWSALGACPLPPAIAIRLTVARDTANPLYEHSLRAAFLALFVGASARIPDGDLQILATAALLHDMGMMHTDPCLYEKGKPLDQTGRRHLLGHPLTGQMIAQREPLLSPIIGPAIAHHHERLDGTGYPRGLEGDAIGRLARVLMLVEVALAVIEKESEQPDLRLSLILRLNRGSFDAALSELVLAALPRPATGDGDSPGPCPEFERVAALIGAWPHLCGETPPAAGDPASAFIDARLGRLRRWLADAGLGDSKAAAAAAAADPAVLAEMKAGACEALWHMRQIAQDALHRWPKLQAGEEAVARSAAAQWVASALSIDRGACA
jgi:HD-GYP domain-containing protein (c-di-GMP phosphodiesterase class II)